MSLFKPIVAISALCVAVTACQSNTQFKEDMLSSSGFRPTRPTTSAQLASLKSLPPHKLTRTIHKGKTVWVYSDPSICGCLYIGDQAAYDAYTQNRTRQTMLDMTTVTVDPVIAGDNWDFSMWPSP